MSWEPAPYASARGSRAKPVAKIVMATGRTRMRAMRRQASRGESPCRMPSLAPLMMKTAFSPTMPTIMIAPT